MLNSRAICNVTTSHW